MKKRIIALLMAAMVTVTSLPVHTSASTDAADISIDTMDVEELEEASAADVVAEENEIFISEEETSADVFLPEEEIPEGSMLPEEALSEEADIQLEEVADVFSAGEELETAGVEADAVHWSELELIYNAAGDASGMFPSLRVPYGTRVILEPLMENCEGSIGTLESCNWSYTNWYGGGSDETIDIPTNVTSYTTDPIIVDCAYFVRGNFTDGSGIGETHFYFTVDYGISFDEEDTATEPERIEAKIGESVTLSANANSKYGAAVSYNWYRWGDDTPFATTDTDTLVIEEFSEYYEGTIICSPCNIYGKDITINGDGVNKSFNVTSTKSHQIYVYDESGNPLVGAEVRLGDQTNYTQDEGSVWFEYEEGYLSLKISCLGYETYEDSEFSLDTDEKSISIYLKDITKELIPGETVTVDTTEQSPQYYAFTPEETKSYVIYSSGDEDTYVSLKQKADGREIASDDESGDGSNFYLIKELQAGCTYIYEVKEYGDEGCVFDITFEEIDIPEITSMEFVSVPTELIEGFTGNGANRIKIEVRYDNGEKSTFDLNGVDSYGNFVSYELSAEGSEETLSFYDMTAGNYVLKVSFGEFDLTLDIRCVPLEDVATELIPGETFTVDTIEESPRFYTFTPETTGTYLIYSHGDEDTYVSLKQKLDGNWTEIAEDDQGGDGSNFYLIRELEAGCTYLYEIKEYDNSGTIFDVTFEEIVIPEISNVEFESMPEVFTEGFTSGIASQIKIKISYDNGETKILDLHGNDSYGNFVSYELFEEGSEEAISFSEMTAGNYVLKVSFGEFALTQNISCVSLEDSATELIPGETVTVDTTEQSSQYYIFTPEETGLYKLYSNGDEDTEAFLKKKVDGEWEEIASDDESGEDSNFFIRCKLEAGVTYLYEVKEYGGAGVIFTMTFEEIEIPNITSVTIDGASKFAVGWENKIHKGIFVRIGYSNGEYEKVYLGKSDLYGNEVTYQFYQGETEVDPSELSWGEYTLKVSVGDVSAEKVITGVDILDIAEKLPVGMDNEYTCQPEQAKFFSFSAKEKTKLVFYHSSRSLFYMDIFKKTDDGWQLFTTEESIELNGERTLLFEAGEYIIRVYHWAYLDDEEEQDEAIDFYFVATEVKIVESIEFASEQKSELVTALDALDVHIVVTFADGTTSNGKIDEYDDRYGIRLYESVNGEQGEEVEYDSGNRDYSGAYILEVYLKDNVEGVSPASKEIYYKNLSEVEKITLIEGTSMQLFGNKQYIMSFVPQNTGKYEFKTDSTSYEVAVYDANMQRMEDAKNYSYMAEMTAGEEYVLVVETYWNTNVSAEFKAECIEVPEIASLAIECFETELVSGVDSFWNNILVKVTYTDGTTLKYWGTPGEQYIDYYNHHIRMKAANADGDTDFFYEEDEYWNPGTYMVWAECWGESDIITSNKVEMVYVPFDLSSFPVIPENELYTITEPGYYKFIPSENSCYRLVSEESYFEIEIKYLDENGALREHYSEEEMTAGKEYFIKAERIPDGKILFTNQDLTEELQLNEAKTIQAVGGLKEYTFIAPYTSTYFVNATYDKNDGKQSRIDVLGEWYDEMYEGDIVSEKSYDLEKGSKLYFEVYPAGSNVTLTVNSQSQESESKKLVDFEIITRPSNGYSMYFAQNEDMLEGLTLIYDDGSREIVDPYTHAAFINRINKLEDGNLVQTYQVDLYIDNVAVGKSASVVLQKDIHNLLKEGEVVDAIPAIGPPEVSYSRYFCEFTPETTGTYLLDTIGVDRFSSSFIWTDVAVKDEDKILDRSNVIYEEGSRFQLEGGITYVLQVNSYSTAMIEQFKIIKCKDVEKVELKTQANDFYLDMPEVYDDSMILTVTYTDGTVEDVAVWDGVYDNYGNYIRCRKELLHSDKAIIFVECGEKWVSCIVENAGAESVPLVTLNTATKIPVKAGTMGARFVPETNGKYKVVLCDVDEWYGGVEIIDAETGKRMNENSVYEAGKTYVYSRYDVTQKEATAVLVNVTGDCKDGHDHMQVVLRESTCDESGFAVIICKNCGSKASVQLPKAHTPGEWQVTKEPTALEEGEKVQLCAYCDEVVAGPEAIEKLTPTMTVNVSSVTLKEKATLSTIKVSNLAKGDYVASWTSSNKVIFTVNAKGVITGVGEGKATLTIKLASGLSKTVAVTVEPDIIKTTEITGLKSAITLKKGSSTTLAPKLVPTNSQEGITFKSSNTKIATVTSKGVVKGVAAGTAYITVKSGSITKKVKVTVPKTATTKITGVSTSVSVKKGKTITLNAKAYPTNSDYGVTYTSENKKIATVTSKGVVKGIKAGTTYITVKSGSITKRVKVTVQKIATTKITGVKSSVSVKRGKTITLNAKPYPTNSDYGITYTSQNKKIATVTSKGVVKGIKAGTTYITIKSGTVTKKVKVTVKK